MYSQRQFNTLYRCFLGEYNISIMRLSCHSIFSIEIENPNTSPTWKIAFGLSLLGPSAEIRTRGLLNPISGDDVPSSVI